MKRFTIGSPANICFVALLVLLASLFVTSTVDAKLLAAAASPNSITISWTAPGDDGGNGVASQYDIRYSTSNITNLNWDNALQAIGIPDPQPAGSPETFTLSNLDPNTTYYIAIKVADEVPNWSDISNVISRTTDPEDIAPDIVADLGISSVSANSVTLSWTATGDDGAIGTATTYDIRYSINPITDVNWDIATQVTGEPSPQAAGADESFVVNGLNAGTQYYFAMKVADEIPNWSALSNVANVSTANEQVAPAAIANLVVGTPTDNSAVLFWSAPGDDGNVGTASEYDIRYFTSTITDLNWNSANQVASLPNPKAAGQPETLLVTGLEQEVTYYFAIKTADEVPNWSTLSNVASTTTIDQTPPAAINDLQAVTAATSGSIQLNWTAPGNDGMLGSATVYEIRYAESMFNDSTWTSASLFLTPPTPDPAGTPQATTVSGLTPGKLYNVAIKSYDLSGNSSDMSNVGAAEAGINIGTDVDDDNQTGLPQSFALSQNYPNPFNPTTAINFALPKESQIDLSVYNIEGKKVTTLVTGNYPAGEHSIEWDGMTSTGCPAATGVYFYRLASETFTDTKKMIMLK